MRQFAVQLNEQDEIPDFEHLAREQRREKVLAIRKQKIAEESDPKKRRSRIKKYRSSDPFIHLTRAERSRLLEDAVYLIASHQKIKLFAEAINKEHPKIKCGEIDPTVQAFEQVVSRFDAFLGQIASKPYQNQRFPRSDCGLLIVDRDAAKESMLETAFRQYREHGHSYGNLRYVIDVPFFAASNKVSGLQLVDVCAYVIRRYLDTGATSGSQEETLFRSIFPLFDRDVRGTLHGLRHYVAADSCECLICKERGHAMNYA